MRVRLAAVVSLALAASPAVARAIDVDNVGGDTLTIDITNTSALGYHFDNRNDAAVGAPPPSSLVDDNYGEWFNHLNVLASYGRFTLGLRIDSSVYFHAQPTETALYALAQKRYPAGGTGVDVWNYKNAFDAELHTRFQDTIYPSKLWIGYSAPGLELTLGDFYAQLGRGLVFSARKIDEVATDTTVRGGKIELKKSSSGGHVSATVFAGQMNPVRFDEASGRQLNGTGSALFPGAPRGSDFTYYTFDQSGHAGYITDGARPSYLEDTAAGISLEAGPKWMVLGGNAAWIFRKSYDEDYVSCVAKGLAGCAAKFPVFDTTNPARLHNRIMTASGSIDFPKIGEFADLYIEAAAQQLADGRAIAISPSGAYKTVPDRTGYAIYLSASVHGGPLSLSLEGKAYKSFFPLSANINSSAASDPAFSAPEYDIVAYNSVPTAEPIYVEEIGQPNQCITGGRMKLDWKIAKPVAAYVWVGNYVSFSEIDPNNFDCSTDPTLRTNTWDAAVGGDVALDHGKSYLKAWIGLRTTDREVPAATANTAGPTETFYREGYIRYDISAHLGGPFTLQFQGLHRHRYEPLLAGDSWNEGENYTALHWSPHMAFIFGYEYLGRTGCEPNPKTTICHYFNGGIQFKAAEDERWWGKIFDTLDIFVGQRRGAIRCVSGVCRQFPPFEGARAELTSRF